MYYSAICTQSDCYKASRTIEPQGIILHSVGCNQPRASVFVGLWNKAGVKVMPHAVIDGSGVIFQTLPYNVRGWHAGGKANNTHVGIEMCEPDSLVYVNGWKFTVSDDDRPDALLLAERTYRSAVELCRDLCVQYALDPRRIISHKEAHEMGIASDHGDPESFWDQLGTGYSMDQFRADVQHAIDARKAWSVTIESVLTKQDADRIVSLLREAGYDASASPV